MTLQDRKKKNFDGVRSAAEMLNVMNMTDRERILTQIAERDPQTAEEIRKKMFVLEDLGSLSPKDLQLLLKEVPRRVLILAMRSMPELVKAQIFRNLPERAGSILKEELEEQGPQPILQVKAAQQEILTLARKLIQEGQIRFKSE